MGRSSTLWIIDEPFLGDIRDLEPLRLQVLKDIQELEAGGELGGLQYTLIEECYDLLERVAEEKRRRKPLVEEK